MIESTTPAVELAEPDFAMVYWCRFDRLIALRELVRLRAAVVRIDAFELARHEERQVLGDGTTKRAGELVEALAVLGKTEQAGFEADITRELGTTAAGRDVDDARLCAGLRGRRGAGGDRRSSKPLVPSCSCGAPLTMLPPPDVPVPECTPTASGTPSTYVRFWSTRPPRTEISGWHGALVPQLVTWVTPGCNASSWPTRSTGSFCAMSPSMT